MYIVTADYNQKQTESDGGLLARVKESPRTVSALIIILIVAAAIYAFSGEQPQEPAGTIDEEVALGTEGLLEDEEVLEEEMVKSTRTPQVAAATFAQQVQELPPAQKVAEGYVETAQPGDGITHVARRATIRWLAENTADYEVTKEHRIYIEDYIQNRIGTQGLALGEVQSISFDLIKEAVTAAKQLNEQQLKNLGKYTHALD